MGDGESMASNGVGMSVARPVSFSIVGHVWAFIEIAGREILGLNYVSPIILVLFWCGIMNRGSNAFFFYFFFWPPKLVF